MVEDPIAMASTIPRMPDQEIIKLVLLSYNASSLTLRFPWKARIGLFVASKPFPVL